MAAESKAQRLSRLCDEIGYALGNGEFPTNQLREFRFLWATTPNQEKDGMSLTLKDIEKLVKELRQEQLTDSAGTKLKSIPVSHITGAEQVTNNT